MKVLLRGWWWRWPGWLLVLAALVWTTARRTDPAVLVQGRPPAPQVGFQAPDFTLTTLDGQTLTLSELRGRPVILNFWASWCPPCKAEMPAMQRVYEDYQAQGLHIVAVNSTTTDPLPNVQAFVDQYGLTFPIPLDQEGRVFAAYRVYSLPTTFFIDAQGVIQDIVIGGPMAEALLRGRAEALLTSGGK